MTILCPHCKKLFVQMNRQIRGTLKERVMGHVFKAPNGCWLWVGGHSGRGYPRIDVNQKSEYAHRVSWMVHKGPIPEGMQVLHNCPTGDNPMCVNPDHLFLGSHTENMRDMAQKGRRRSFGIKCRTSRLTEIQVLEIRSRWPGDLTEKELGLEYGITQVHVSSIVLGYCWKHLPIGKEAALAELNRRNCAEKQRRESLTWVSDLQG